MIGNVVLEGIFFLFVVGFLFCLLFFCICKLIFVWLFIFRFWNYFLVCFCFLWRFLISVWILIVLWREKIWVVFLIRCYLNWWYLKFIVYISWKDVFFDLVILMIVVIGGFLNIGFFFRSIWGGEFVVVGNFCIWVYCEFGFSFL